MKLTVSFRDSEKPRSVENELGQCVKKLGALLRSYAPDLVQLHAVFSKTTRTEEHELSLNLTLPTGTLHATAKQEHVRACCKKAFSEIEAQLKKHQSRLRKDYEWKRKRHHRTVEAFS